MRTACYLRFSSDNQKETSIQDQQRCVEDFCGQRGWKKPAVFQDMAITGARNDRPGYLAMLRAAHKKEFDILVVYDLSRLSRDRLETEKTIRLLKYLDISIIGVSDGTDTSGANSKIDTTLKGLMNELYLDKLSTDVKRGLTSRVLEGYNPGRFAYGYTTTNDGKGSVRVINEETAQWVRYIYARFAEGATTRVIAKELNEKGVPSPQGSLWVHSTLEPTKGGSRTGLLANPLYAGKYLWKKTKKIKDPVTNKSKQIEVPESEWMVQEVPHLRIVDDELWNKVQERVKKTRAKNLKRTGGRPSSRLFNGILRCGVCGAPYVLKNTDYYGCKNTVYKPTSTCTNRANIKQSVLIDMVLGNVRQELLTDEAFHEFEVEATKLLSSEVPSTAPISSRLMKAEKELDNIMMAIRAGVVTVTTKAALEDAEQKVAAIKAELKQAESMRREDMLPFARKVYEEMVQKLGDIENVYLARDALRQLLGTVTLRPATDGPTNKGLVAEVEHGTLSSVLSEMLPSPQLWEHFRQPKPLTINLK